MTAPTIHLWNHCHHCGQDPIIGLRYECQTCPIGPDADFCSACHALIQQGAIAHPSSKHSLAHETIGQVHRFIAHEGTSSAPLAGWLEVPVPVAAAPSLANGAVVRPEFCVGFESSFASYAFSVYNPTDGRPLLLTAIHVMDELLRKQGVDAHGDNAAYSGRELPAKLTHVNLYDVFAANWMLSFLGKTGRMLVLPGARLRDPEPRSDRDIAAFAIDDPSGLAPLQLSAAPPSPGDPLWLAASFGGGHSQRLFKAVVVEVWDQGMIFRYEDEADGPKYTSGAPLLDSKGQVAALNVGGGRYGGKRFGHGNHVANIRSHLASATRL